MDTIIVDEDGIWIGNVESWRNIGWEDIHAIKVNETSVVLTSSAGTEEIFGEVIRS